MSAPAPMAHSHSHMRTMPRPTASSSSRSTADSGPCAGREHQSDIEAGCQAICVDPARLADAWPLVAPFIRRAAERDDRSDVMRIVHDLRNGSALLWLAWDGKAVCG